MHGLPLLRLLLHQGAAHFGWKASLVRVATDRLLEIEDPIPLSPMAGAAAIALLTDPTEPPS
jgi:hypothetical protein